MTTAAGRMQANTQASLQNFNTYSSEQLQPSENDLKNRQVLENALADRYARIPVQFQSHFYDYLYKYNYHNLRQIHLLALLAFLLYFFADIFIIPDLMMIAGLTRVTLVLAGWVACELLFKYSQNIRILDLALPIGTMIYAGVWILLLLSSSSPHVENYLYASAIFILITNLCIKAQFKAALYCSILTSLLVLVAMTQLMTLSEAFIFTVVFSPVLLFSLYFNWNNILHTRRAFIRTLLDEWNYHMVRNLAHTDELTQLYNRRHFVNLAENCIHDWPRYSSTCLLMFDVDHFKQINDNYGHDVGDRVLQLIADTARKEMRHSDVLARFGGEEFIILLSETQLQDALVIAERIRNSIQQQHLYAQPELALKFTVSIGIAELESHTQDLDDLIKKADVALYAAKKYGRNRIEVYRPDMSLPLNPDLNNFYSEKYIKL
ncbi:GGDEF domain-containing protein [Acinetobacter sp. LoGeW2-3]|uniref:GGDEF domain-containing protein n=1 Tax=Acinetobacter sp. LoGeW2-3 TaxID=1808001 RepID=UPI000C059B22|nr:GGDEF domain-containing protein [Acinetobacter sp. LoGeW2-3]ATO19255.1 GGDEF domain-containing protein [Acinetobacter sp. LoGeW2-3]